MRPLGNKHAQGIAAHLKSCSGTILEWVLRGHGVLALPIRFGARWLRRGARAQDVLLVAVSELFQAGQASGKPLTIAT